MASFLFTFFHLYHYVFVFLFIVSGWLSCLCALNLQTKESADSPKKFSTGSLKTCPSGLHCLGFYFRSLLIPWLEGEKAGISQSVVREKAWILRTTDQRMLNEIRSIWSWLPGGACEFVSPLETVCPPSFLHSWSVPSLAGELQPHY